MTQWTISLNDKPIKRFTLKEGWNLIIGRGVDSDIIVDNTAISRQHSSIELKDGRYILTDLGSLNGTFVNGKRITGPTHVTEHDVINLGKFRLSISEDGEPMHAASYGAHPSTEDQTIIISAERLAAKTNVFDSKKPDHKLVLIEGHAVPKQIALKGKSSIKIGKDASCDMVLSGLFVAGAQAYIVAHADQFKLIPQRSWASTFLNDRKIKGEQLLSKGDIIKVRSTKIRLY